MKKIIYLLISGLTIGMHLTTKANGNSNNNQHLSDHFTFRANTIDSNDSVVFDLSQAAYSAGKVSFPVYIQSTDTINALDFSIKFNQNNFVYDSIINLTSYLQGVSYFNSSDSTIRFSSYSLLPISIDTPLVMLSFQVVSGQFCVSDFYEVNVLLNGDPCTSKIENCISTGIDQSYGLNSTIIYPNPASNSITIVAKDSNDYFQLLNSVGQILLYGSLKSESNNTLNTGNFPRGFYFLKVFGKNAYELHKIILN